MLFLFEHLPISFESLEEVFLFCDGIEQCAVVPFPIEEPVDELFGVLDVSAAANHVVCALDCAIFSDDAFHLVLEEALEEEVGEQDVDALLLLLQLVAHRAHHHLLQLTPPLLPTNRRLVPPAQNLMQRIYLDSTLRLLAVDRALDGLQHVPATVAHLGLVELLLTQAAQPHRLLPQGTVLVEVALPHDQDVLLESLLHLPVDVEVVSARLDEGRTILKLVLPLLQVLHMAANTFFVLSMCWLRRDCSSLSASHCLRSFYSSFSSLRVSVLTSSYRLRVSATRAASSCASSGRE
jgi:hypothetical protein